MKLEFFERIPSYRFTRQVGSLLTPMVNEKILPRPYLMTFVVTRRCNSRCKMCNIWQEKDSPFLSLEQIRAIFSGDFSFVRQLVLTGGEPTLRSDLPELFQIVKDACPQLEHVELATSGLNVRRTIKYVAEMLKSAVQTPNKIKTFIVQISVDGIDEMHDEIRGIEGFFDKIQSTLDGLDELKNTYPFLTYKLSCVIMPQNLHHIPLLQKFAAQRGTSAHFSPVVLSGEYYRNLHGVGDLTFGLDEHGDHEAVNAFQSLARTERSSLKFYYEDVSQILAGASRSRTCMMGYYGFILEHDGNVFPCVNCEYHSFGNLLEQSFDEIWFGEAATKARNLLRKDCCPTCVSMCYTPPINLGEMIKLSVLKLKNGHPYFSTQ